MKSLFRESYSKIIQKSIRNRIKNHIKMLIDFESIFDANISPKMEPKTPRSITPAATLGPQQPLKSLMDPFSRKSKPPDLNFIKKMTLEHKI